jgi:hypothetical protein
VGTDRFYIALSEEPGLAPSGERDGATICHLGFTTTDLDGVRRHLAEDGVSGGDDVHDRKEGRAIYVFDPDGHEIEVVEYRRGYVYA